MKSKFKALLVLICLFTAAQTPAQDNSNQTVSLTAETFIGKGYNFNFSDCSLPKRKKEIILCAVYENRILLIQNKLRYEAKRTSPNPDLNTEDIYYVSLQKIDFYEYKITKDENGYTDSLGNQKIYYWLKLQTKGHSQDIQHETKGIVNRTFNEYSINIPFQTEKQAESALDIFKIKSKETKEVVFENTKEEKKEEKKEIQKSTTITNSAAQNQFFAAIKTWNEETIRNSLTNGANINAYNEFGQTALFMVIDGSNNELSRVKFLVSNGSDVNARHEKSWTTVLCWAMYRGTIETVKYLVSNGANVNALSGMEQTCTLNSAIESKNLEAVKILVEAGAKINKVSYWSKEKRSPLKIAIDMGLNQIADYLKSKGASEVGITEIY